MKLHLPRRESSAVPSSDSAIGRRGLVAGAGVAGAAAVAAAALHRSVADPGTAVAANEKAASGYRLTDHIRKYYASTKA